MPDDPEQGVIIQPGGMLLPEIGECRAIPVVRVVFKTRPGLREGGVRKPLVLFQPATCDQIIDTDQVCIAGVHGHALIGRTVVVNRTQWQGLPYTEPALPEKIDKTPGLVSQTATGLAVGQ